MAIVLIIPALIYLYLNDSYKRSVLLEQKKEKELNQLTYDKCVRIAEHEYVWENRAQCWVLKHDAIDCDTSAV